MWNWIAKKDRTGLPHATPLELQKASQIEQLKVFRNSVVEIQRDVEYQVHTTINNKQLYLIIVLPPSFPQEKPQVKVTPGVAHPWLNQDMHVVGSPYINQFSVHSDLAVAIKEIIAEFDKNPPHFMNHHSHGTEQLYKPYELNDASKTSPEGKTFQYQQANQPKAVTDGSALPSSQTPRYPQAFIYSSMADRLHTQSRPGLYLMPDIPSHFGQLHDVSNDELRVILESEDRLLESVQNSKQLRQLQDDRDAICGCNETLARDNLSKKPIIEERKKCILEKYDELTEFRTKFDELSTQQNDLRQRCSPIVIRDRLQIASAGAENDAEKIADDFLDGKLKIDKFLKKFMQERTRSHLLKVTEEKLHGGLIHIPFS